MHTNNTDSIFNSLYSTKFARAVRPLIEILSLELIQLHKMTLTLIYRKQFLR